MAKRKKKAAPTAEDVLLPPIGDDLAVMVDTMQTVDDTGVRLSTDAAHTPQLTGGDIDAAWDQSDSGEESVGGSTPTPDQDVVDDLGAAAGIIYPDEHPLALDKAEARDDERWELDPASSEDFEERRRSIAAPPRRHVRPTDK
jgi:hypothetical protein